MDSDITRLFLAIDTQRLTSKSLPSSVTSVVSAGPEAASIRSLLYSGSSGVGDASELTAEAVAKSGPERVYPEAFDPTSDIGAVRVQLSQALADARAALDAFDDANLSEVASNVACVAVSLKSSYVKLKGNDALASLIAFSRRATLTFNPLEVNRAMLNSLIRVLRDISDNPVIGYAEAADLADVLGDAGWKGEDAAIEELAKSLIAEYEVDRVGVGSKAEV